MNEVTKQDLFNFIGEGVRYDEFVGGYIWGIDNNGGEEMIAKVYEPEKNNDDETYTERFQNFIGQFISDAINEKLQREKGVTKTETNDMKLIIEEIISQKREIIDGALRNEVVDVSVVLNKAESLGIIFKPKF